MNKKKKIFVLAIIVFIFAFVFGVKFPVNLQSKEIEQAIAKHMINERENAENHLSENEKWFVSTKIYRTDKKLSGTVIVYAWVLAESYYMENGELKEGSGWSVPRKILLLHTDEGYKITRCYTPGDGTDYKRDMRILFPIDVRLQMNRIHDDDTIENMQKENQAAAEKYFK